MSSFDEQIACGFGFEDAFVAVENEGKVPDWYLAQEKVDHCYPDGLAEEIALAALDGDEADEITEASPFQTGFDWNAPVDENTFFFAPGWGKFGVSPIVSTSRTRGATDVKTVRKDRWLWEEPRATVAAVCTSGWGPFSPTPMPSLEAALDTVC